ncbi:MAG: hypothetical protein IPJ65_26170 [Archangiaceae bacterium]|nr:hypothetical protein [Archangiaceae bacterium]
MRGLLLLALLLSAGACTLLTSFDPEGQPCDTTTTNAGSKCLANFHCQNGKCVKGAFDGGT